MKEVTFVCTSCGRLDLLKITINSFLKYNTYPIKKFIVIDNSTIKENKKIIESFFHEKCNVQVIINDENIGQVSSIDKAYSLVDTEYIFHTEDDWEYINTEFIEKSLDVLEHDLNVINVNIRVRYDGEKGSTHPIENNVMSTKNGHLYMYYAYGYYGSYHGFSWNPGLRRLSDYKLIGNYKQYKNEEGFNDFFYKLNKKAACLENFYCKHIGTHSNTPLSNI